MDWLGLKIIYSEKGKISQNFVAFSEYMNFNGLVRIRIRLGWVRLGFKISATLQAAC